MQVEIQGIAMLAAKMQRMGINIEKALDKACGVTAMKIREDAIKFCPHDTNWLRQHIYAEKAEKPCCYYVGTNIEYAPFVEYGTGQRGNPKVPHVTTKKGTYPHPFLEPALIANSNYLYKQAQVCLIKALKEKIEG